MFDRVPLSTLDDRASGRYRVGTESGSAYLVNLSRCTVRRLPSGIEEISANLRRDGETVDLLLLIDCTVGQRMTHLIDLHIPGVKWTHRTSTPVVSITELGPDEEE